MTISIGTIWDRAVDVLRGRAGILGPLAVLTVFLPNVVSSAITLYAAPAGIATSLLTVAVALAVLVVSMWGQLAMLAVATHPATTRADAGRQATARLLPAIGVVMAVGIALSLAIVPPVIALMQSGVDFTNATPATMPAIPAGVSGFLGIYFFLFIIAAFWLGARLVLLNPVILNERRGLGAVKRSVALTRGLTWRLVGVMLLFVVVLMIATTAIQFVVALPLRVVLGSDALPTVLFLARIAGAAVTTVFTVIAAAFTAQLYVAAAGDA